MRAKISLFVLAFVVAVSSIVNAQSDNDSKFNFGLKLSPTIAWFKAEGNGLKGAGSKIGFAYGLIADINFAKNYCFETGIDVTYRGGKTKYSPPIFGDEGTTSSTLQYVELPLTLKLKTNEIGYMTYFGRVGFAPGINIRATSGGESAKSAFQPINLSLLVGLGAQYSLGGKTALLVGLTYNNGFVDILKSNDSKIMSSYIALDLGIMF